VSWSDGAFLRVLVFVAPFGRPIGQEPTFAAIAQ
jgi:hypothetical protein